MVCSLPAFRGPCEVPLKGLGAFKEGLRPANAPSRAPHGGGRRNKIEKGAEPMTVEIKLMGEADEIAALAKILQEPQQMTLPNYIPASEAGSARTAS